MATRKKATSAFHQLFNMDITGSLLCTSELNIGAEFENPAATANLMAFAKRQLPNIIGWLFDGINLRIDRAMAEAMIEIPPHEQVHWLFNKFMEFVKLAAKNARKSVPKADIVLFLGTDDLQHMAQRMLTVIVQSHIVKRQMNMKALKERNAEKTALIRELQKMVVHLTKEREKVKGVRGKGAESNRLLNEIKATNNQIHALHVDIEKRIARIKQVSSKISRFRDSKNSAAYQRRTAEHMRKLIKRYREICNEYDIRLQVEPGIINFKHEGVEISIDHAHSRHRTWAPNPNSAKEAAKSIHKRYKAYAKNTRMTLQELGANAEKVDFITEGGHHGIAYATLQKSVTSVHHANFQHVNTFDSRFNNPEDDVEAHHHMVVMPPFFDQARAYDFLNLKKPARTQGGKAMGSNAHHVLTALDKGGVSGTFIGYKHANGLTSREFIEYDRFLNGSALAKLPPVMAMTILTSDEHIASYAEDPLGLYGVLRLTEYLCKHPIMLHGSRCYIGGFISGGDTLEPGTQRWYKRPHYRRNIRTAISTYAKRLVHLKDNDVDEIFKLTMRIGNDAMGGSNENVGLGMSWVKDYYYEMYKIIESMSPCKLQAQHISVPGNHADGALENLGLREHMRFADVMEGKGYSHFQVGALLWRIRRSTSDCRERLWIRTRWETVLSGAIQDQSSSRSKKFGWQRIIC